MRKHLGKARYASILLLAVVAAILLFRLSFVNNGPRRAAAMFPAPTASDLAIGLIRAGLDPEALAAAALSSQQVNAAMTRVSQYLVDHQAELELADAARAQARIQCDGLRRVIQSGTATQEQVDAFPAAQASLAQAESQLNGLVNGVFDAATGGLPQAQRTTLATIRANRAWDLPVEFLVADGPEAQWVQLRDALANERISQDLDESPDPEAQAWLAQCRGNPLVASAEANLDANLASVTAAWNQAASPP